MKICRKNFGKINALLIHRKKKLWKKRRHQPELVIKNKLTFNKINELIFYCELIFNSVKKY